MVGGFCFAGLRADSSLKEEHFSWGPAISFDVDVFAVKYGPRDS